MMMIMIDDDDRSIILSTYETPLLNVGLFCAVYVSHAWLLHACTTNADEVRNVDKFMRCDYVNYILQCRPMRVGLRVCYLLVMSTFSAQ